MNLKVFIILRLGFTTQIMMQLKSSFIYDVNNNLELKISERYLKAINTYPRDFKFHVKERFNNTI